MALGGEPGARLANTLAMPISGDTVLRLIRSVALAPVPPPRVIGIDERAWRPGHRYGTILVDLERNIVVDLLPDRQAEHLAAWLRHHPGVEIVARDRAGAYADGIRQGAPQAVQVADRWHLLRNFGDAEHAVVHRQHARIRRISRQRAEDQALLAAAQSAATPKPVRVTAAEQRRAASYVRRQARYEEAARLKAAGLPLKRIAAVTGAERKTIRRWLRAGAAPSWRHPRRVGILAPHHTYLDRRWNEGCHSAAQLWRERVTGGFAGRPGIVRHWTGQRRKGAPQTTNVPGAHDVADYTPSARQITRLLVSDDAPSEAQQSLVSRWLAELPGLADCVAAAKRLKAVLRRNSKETLEAVLTAAAGTALKDFVANLRRDLSAVQAALDLPWTTSPAEGQISRLKLLKRSMYGRAGFTLLRARVLHAA